MTPLQRYEAAKAAAQTIVNTAKAEGRDLTADEQASFDQHVADATAAKAQHERNVKSDAALADLGPRTRTHAPAKALHPFVKAATEAVVKLADPLSKALTVTGSVALPTDLLGDIEAKPRGLRFVSQLLAPVRRIATAEYSYLRQTTRTNNAAPVAIGAVKPTSVLGLERVTAPVETIAHLTEPIARQYLEDEAALTTFVADELLYGLYKALDGQVVSGSGMSPELEGIVNLAGAQPQAWDTNALRTTRKGLTLLQDAGVADVGDPSADRVCFVLHPTDWETIELTVAAGSGEFLTGGPVNSAARSLWGIPVLVSSSVTAGVGILGDFSRAELVARGPVGVTWSEAVSDDFERNFVRFRCEGRFGFEVIHPGAFVILDLTAA